MGASDSGDLQVLAMWAGELAETFVALSADVSLVIDDTGHITRMAQRESRPIAPPTWVGQPWSATAGPDSQGKAGELLAEARTRGTAGERELNHPEALEGPAALAWRAVRLGGSGPVLAVGRDLRANVALQQRFVAAQEALERSYWQARQDAEAAGQERARAAARDAVPAVGAEPGPAPVPQPARTELTWLRMTDGERASLGLPPLPERVGQLADGELVQALGRLIERIGHDELGGLLRDARRLVERHFLARALARAGSLDALERSLRGERRRSRKRPRH